MSKVKKMYVGVDNKASLLLDFDNIGEKASINSVNLAGDLTSSDLGIPEEQVLTYAEYLALPSTEKNSGKSFYVTDAPTLGNDITADDMTYDNTESGLTATVVQDAIDELADEKQNEITVTASRALVSDASGKVSASDITATELGYLDGVTSNVQTQLNEVSSLSVVNGALNMTFEE